MNKLKISLLVVGILTTNKVYAVSINQDMNGTQVTVAAPITIVSSVTVAGALAVSSATASTSNGFAQFNYITNVHIEMYATGTLTGGATPVTCTSSNIPGNPVWKFPTAAATGTVTITDMQFANALKSTTSNTVTSITCPATASVIWNITLGYYQSN